jgi:hypothetical protein
VPPASDLPGRSSGLTNASTPMLVARTGSQRRRIKTAAFDGVVLAGWGPASKALRDPTGLLSLLAFAHSEAARRSTSISALMSEPVSVTLGL